jgi:hypothetical protein
MGRRQQMCETCTFFLNEELGEGERKFLEKLDKIVWLYVWMIFDRMLYSFGFWIVISVKSLSGAMISSYFLLLTRTKVKSFCGSMSRTTLRALLVNCIIKPAYWTVVELSRVERIGIPSLSMIMAPVTPFAAEMRFIVSSTSDMVFQKILKFFKKLKG